MAKDTLDKQFVIKFFRRKGIEVHLFLQSSVKKSPDLELHIDNDLFAYCELKSIVPCKSPSTNLAPGQMRKEKIIDGNASVNDIKKGIHGACKQLRSVNPDHKVPNIVFLINHNRLRNVGDLRDVIGVEEPNGPGFFCPLYNKLIGKEDLEVVDYIIFLESQERDIRDKKECRESRVLNDYVKGFLKYADRDEKWAKKAICENWFSNIAYYFFNPESYFRDSLKEKISSKTYEILTNFANNRKKG